MNDQIMDDLVGLLPPLMQSLEALAFVARHLNPPDFAAVLDAAGHPDALLAEARPCLESWPDGVAGLRTLLQSSADAALAGFAGLRAAPDQDESLAAAYRALRFLPRAQEALYPLAAGLPAVSRFFLPPERRDDPALQALASQANPETGIIHAGNEPGTRGGFSLYVPEYYTPDRPWPLVMALHGGSSNGRGFLWSWLTDVRAEGAILVTPTATGDTWALTGRDQDTPNLARILDLVGSRYHLDRTRLLLTGMSDGGTFSYVTGLEMGSPFTHLAPVAATFHPMMAEMADPQRVRGLPVHIVHGALDWLFPIAGARTNQQALAAAGARVTYREIPDLSHCYPRDANPGILAWLRSSPVEVTAS